MSGMVVKRVKTDGAAASSGALDAGFPFLFSFSFFFPFFWLMELLRRVARWMLVCSFLVPFPFPGSQLIQREREREREREKTEYTHTHTHTQRTTEY